MQTIYVDEGIDTPFKKSNTRWLVQGPVMERIRSNWDGLQVGMGLLSFQSLFR